MAIVVKIDTSAITEKIEGCFDDDAKLFFITLFTISCSPMCLPTR